jgi:hypothetical protein
MHTPGTRRICVAIAVGILAGPRAVTEEVCTDARDNDADGFIDCADADCCAEPSCIALGCTLFKRGDVDGDGRRTVTDAILILHSLFGGGGPLSCNDASDLDDSDAVDVADPIYLLRYIFQGGPEPPPPFLECDKDPTQGRLSCGLRFACG